MEIGHTLIESGPDGVLAFDRQCRYTFWNGAMERIAGVPRAHVIGRPAFEVFPFLRETGEDAFFNAALEGRTAVSRDRPYRIPETGRVGFFDGHYVPVRGEGGSVVGGAAIIRDVTERHYGEMRRIAQMRATEVLAGISTEAEAAAGVLRAIAEAAGWAFGTLWEATPEAPVLHCRATWSSNSRFEPFERATRARTFAAGEALPGAVWRGFEPIWLRDVTLEETFARRAVARAVGLRTMLCFPIRIGGRAPGVIELLTDEPLDPDQEIIDLVGDLGAHLGNFIERRRAEAGVAESRALFQSFMDHCPAIAFMKDADGRHVYANRRFEEVLALEPGAWRGKTDADLFPPEIAEHFRANDCEVLASGRSVEVLETSSGPDGRRQWLSFKFPFADARGATLLAGMSVEVTEQKRAEAALRQSEERFRQLAENIREVFYVTDIRVPQLLYVSPAYEEIWGRSAKSLYADLRTFIEAIHPDDRARVVQALDRQASGQATQVEYRLVRPDGKVRHVLDRAFPLRDESGAVYRVVGTAADITERRIAEAALEEANRRKDEFLATLGHELRNPLAPILAAAELLRVRGSDDPVVRRAQETIRRQVQQMRRLLDDLLDVARITRGIVTLRKERLDLENVVAHAVQTARPLFEERGQRVTISAPRERAIVEGDPARLEQVVTNLLSNAAKFTPRGGDVVVVLDLLDAEAVIRVRDNGRGISAEMLTRIFDLFTQASPSVDRTEGGLGIGLTVVRRLVEMHGGHVSAHSAGLGKGSEFVVRLPLPATTSVDGRVGSQDGPVVPSRPLRVLVVDDNIDAARMLGELLPLWGHEARVAHSGREALDVATELEPDVVLLDLGLPEMDGFEVARRLRADLGKDRVRLVALTGFGLEEDRRRTREAGFSHHLTKPVDPDDLQRVLTGLAPEP